MNERSAENQCAYEAGEAMEQVIGGVLTGYRLTIRDARDFQYTPWRRDHSLPRYALRVSASDDAIIYTVDEWRGRDDALRENLRAWILDHVQLAGSRRGRGRRPDPDWLELWRQANPGRST